MVSYSGGYSVDESFNPDSPFFPFGSSRRVGGPTQVPGNVKRKKDVSAELEKSQLMIKTANGKQLILVIFLNLNNPFCRRRVYIWTLSCY